jgi:hypothetical protein
MDINTSKISSKLYFMFLAASLFSCSKNTGRENIKKDPVVVAFDRLEPVSDMRVFTGGGVILDPAVDKKQIESYLDRNYSIKTSAGTRFYQSRFSEPGSTAEYGHTAFTFYDDGRVRYGADIINVKDLGGTRILRSMVTNKIEDDPIVVSDLFKYKFDTNLNGTYNYQYVVHGDNRRPEVSLLYYKLVRYDDQGNLKSLAFGTVHNELNELFSKTLTRFDTLAVKAYIIRYSAK